MKRHISYPKIKQFRNVIADIIHSATFTGLDENGDATYDNSIGKPVITFQGTTKLHGTNAGVSFNTLDGYWAQSRKNVITPEKDNAGFAFFAESKKNSIMKMFSSVAMDNEIDLTKQIITIYGEWCGGNIQKGVAISGLPKMWVIFGVKVSPRIQDTDDTAYWVDHTKLSDEENGIYNITKFTKFEVQIDFERPDLAQEKIAEMVLDVEKECPVGKYFGRTLGEDNTTGEGIVFTGSYKGNWYRFKAKGKEHSTSKVKTIAPVDVEKMNSIHNFVEYAVTENRLQQGVEQVFTSDSEVPTIKMMGAFLKWVSNDIIAEEMDVMDKNGLEPKNVTKQVSNKAREWFLNYLDKQVGLA